jgi:hypothetical protein
VCKIPRFEYGSCGGLAIPLREHETTVLREWYELDKITYPINVGSENRYTLTPTERDIRLNLPWSHGPCGENKFTSRKRVFHPSSMTPLQRRSGRSRCAARGGVEGSALPHKKPMSIVSDSSKGKPIEEKKITTLSYPECKPTISHKLAGDKRSQLKCSVRGSLCILPKH